jgi:branched-chain amino acid transport system ATP-binding protein
LIPSLDAGSVGRDIEVRNLAVVYGGVVALDGIDLTLARGEILGLIGPNGAGKTTLVNAITGFQKPSAGSVRLGDRDVTGWPAHKLARLGVVRTFQGVRSFGRLSVLENIEAGGVGIGVSARTARAEADRLVVRFNLQSYAHSRADSLPYGEERKLDIARALAARPQFLLLDEPGAGLNEQETDDLSRLVTSIREQVGCGILIIDHDMRFVMGLVDRLCVLDHGRTVRIGTPDEVGQDEKVVAAYLGAG